MICISGKHYNEEKLQFACFSVCIEITKYIEFLWPKFGIHNMLKEVVMLIM